MIDLVEVSKSYVVKGIRKSVLEGITFSFPPNRNIAIMGPNGAGKSTLLRLISGSEQPDEGRILRRGRVSWPLGFSGGFNGSMTGVETVRFVARIYGQDTEAILEHVAAFAELGPSFGLPIRTYSSGMKTRLAFGMSLAMSFDCYLVDEVISVGDERFRKKTEAAFQDKIRSARMIMISHSIRQIRQYCSCGLLLAHRGAWYFDDIEALIAAYRRT